MSQRWTVTLNNGKILSKLLQLDTIIMVSGIRDAAEIVSDCWQICPTPDSQGRVSRRRSRRPWQAIPTGWIPDDRRRRQRHTTIDGELSTDVLHLAKAFGLPEWHLVDFSGKNVWICFLGKGSAFSSSDKGSGASLSFSQQRCVIVINYNRTVWNRLLLSFSESSALIQK